MPASTLSGRSIALLRVNLDKYTSEGRSISHGKCTRTPKSVSRQRWQLDGGQCTLLTNKARILTIKH